MYYGITKTLIYLLTCSLNNKTADINNFSAVELKDIFLLADSHKLASCAAFALENIGLDDELFQPWKQAKSVSIRRNLLLNNERNEIYSYMEENHILHVSLKGIVLQDMDPKFGMREMGDNDIMFDPTYQEKIYDYMAARGYHAKIYKKVNHDEYIKPPIYNFEFHNALFLKSDNEKLYEYYSTVFDRLILIEGKNYEYRLSDEDFYIYNIAHAYKHYSLDGTGLRILTDTYVFLKNKKDTLNISYIETECAKIGLTEFELMCRTLSLKLFSPDSDCYSLSEEEKNFLNRIIMSGAYGKQELGVESKLNKMFETGESTKAIKWKYYFKRIFVSLDFIKDVYPFYYRHKILIPVLWVSRIFKALTVNRSRIKSEIKSLDDTIDKLQR